MSVWVRGVFVLLLSSFLCADGMGSTLVRLGSQVINLHPEWRVFQRTQLEDSYFTGIKKGDGEVHLYVSAFPTSSSTLFDGIDYFEKIHNEKLESLEYQAFTAARHFEVWGKLESKYIAVADWSVGNEYYRLHSYAPNLDSAIRQRHEILAGLSSRSKGIGVLSLTDSSYTGNKFYLGWGAAGSMDPSFMHNEVKYDVLHTHDIFTKQIGGKYEGIKLIGPSIGATKVRNTWNSIKSKMSSNDMYVQYSSGHGFEDGLGIGLTYNEMRDFALDLPAREVVIFTMACFSGGLVNSFNAKKSTWSNWPDQGRTLVVFVSSEADNTSSTGPMKDSDEPGGPQGSAGSAFGHALWKALIGYADGYAGGAKDGYLSVDEIIKYTTQKTFEVSGSSPHRPVSTGAYSGGLIMARVPPKGWAESVEHSSENLSDAEVMEKLRELEKYRYSEN